VQPCPQASFDAGLDLFGIRRLRTVATLRHLRQILSREPKLRGRDLLQLHDVDEFVLRGDRPLAFQVDGDDLGDRTEVVFRAVPRALDVVV
jgi:diacylglycerol kinase family enzyme